MKVNGKNFARLALSAMIVAMLCFAITPAVYGQQTDMQKALASLQSAKAALEKAPATAGGHRVKAIQLVDQAMNEVKAGMEYARTHPEKAGKAEKESGITITVPTPK